MPRGDGTGPLGFGPMTGRGAGNCAGFAGPGFANPRGGRRFFGHGGGYGRRFGWAAPAPVPPGCGMPSVSTGESAAPSTAPVEAALNELRAQAEHLKQALGQITFRIEELEGGKRETAE